MAFGDKTFARRVEEKVAALEEASAAEVVVAVAPSSGSYADVDLLWGALAGLGALAAILYGPWVIRPEAVLLDVGLLGALAWWLSRRVPAMRRLLTRSSRRRAQVEEAARRIFWEEGVSATRERTGVLLYLSLLEGRAAVIPDFGIDGRVPRAVWNEVRHLLGQARHREDLVARLFEVLDRLKERLPAHLPPEDDNPDEIPNAPRMRV